MTYYFLEGVDDSSVEHVFISYERNDREMVELINDSLKVPY